MRILNFSATKKIRFTYYLKPTSKDRKMEFDPKRNLLNGLEGTNIRIRKYQS
jgi:hypothetical protein